MAAALAATLAVLVVVTVLPAAATTDRLPDLGMARLQNLQVENTVDGQKLLRFDTVIVNIGAGKFELRGRRPNTSTAMTVTQRIYNDAGGYRNRATTARMYFAGDGHNHWHVRDLEEYYLVRFDNGKLVGTGAKEGFCFHDNYPFGSTQDAYYTSCGHDPDALRVSMGLSRGWGDIYTWQTVGQYIDITDLKSGRYRLRAKADAGEWFRERHENNNFTWVDIRLQANLVSIIDYGPAAKRI